MPPQQCFGKISSDLSRDVQIHMAFTSISSAKKEVHMYKLTRQKLISFADCVSHFPLHPRQSCIK
jgi:hypothetical protein